MNPRNKRKDVAKGIKTNIKKDGKIFQKNKEIGERIKQLRQDYKETQEDLSVYMDLTQNSISKIECGEVTLTLENLLKISEHYNVSPDYLCNGTGDSTLLVTLRKYVNLTYSNWSEGDDIHCTYPLLEFDYSFYKYLFQIYQANISPAPYEIKTEWCQKATEYFFKQSKQDSAEKLFFVPVPRELVYPDDKKTDWKQSDLLREIDNYFRNIMKEA